MNEFFVLAPLFFGTGIAASFSVCFPFCLPIILPYIAATQDNWKGGLRTIFLFMFTRLAVYSILGFLSVLFGKLLIRWLHHHAFLGGGIVISGIGILIILGKDYHHRLCELLRKKIVDGGVLAPVFLGFGMGVFPCAPLLGVLGCISLKVEAPWQGGLYGLIFGAGKFISLLIPLSVLTALLPKRIFKAEKAHHLFGKLCGCILFLMGINLILFHR